RHTRFSRDWSSDVCSSDLGGDANIKIEARGNGGNIVLLARGEEGGNVEIDALSGLYISAPVANISGENVTIGNYGVALIHCKARSEERRVGKRETLGVGGD